MRNRGIDGELSRPQPAPADEVVIPQSTWTVQSGFVALNTDPVTANDASHRLAAPSPGSGLRLQHRAADPTSLPAPIPLVRRVQ